VFIRINAINYKKITEQELTGQVERVALVTKRYDDPIEVDLGGHLGTEPIAFSWRGRRYSVHRLIKYWREAMGAWDPDRFKDDEFFRVEADGGTYDLRHLLAGASSWRLSRVWD